MNVVMIIPTGIGCEIGGHAGDATPAARLLGACCDKIFIHPNVVNASDINEMPENALYVEGSILDGFLRGEVELKEVKQNKILVVVNSPVDPTTINTVSAARAILGVDAKILELKTPLKMKSCIVDGIACGDFSGVDTLIEQVSDYEFDALAISTEIEMDKRIALDYFRNGGTNPWGGVEALTSRAIVELLRKPVAHAPFEIYKQGAISSFNEVVDARMAAEAAAGDFLYCCLKGLHKAPRIGKGLTNKDVDYLVTPMGCVGRPHQACMEAGIPIIAVRENKSVLKDEMPSDWIYVNTYLEAAGFLMAENIGLSIESVRRPLEPTEVFNCEPHEIVVMESSTKK